MVDIDHSSGSTTPRPPAATWPSRAIPKPGVKALRPTDLLARYGGEEFINHPDAHRTRRARPGRRAPARERCRRFELPTEQGVLKFTISVGVSTFYKRSLLQEEVIGRADRRSTSQDQRSQRVCGARSRGPAWRRPEAAFRTAPARRSEVGTPRTTVECVANLTRLLN